MEPGREEILRKKQMAFIGRTLACFPYGIMDRLSTIRISADVLGSRIKQEEQWNEEDSKEFIRILSTIDKQINTLSRKSRYLDRFAQRMDRTFTTLNPVEIVEEVVSFSGRFARMRQVELTLNAEKKLPDLYSDPLRIYLIVSIMVDDILARLKRGGKVMVELDKEDNSALIKVQGHGAPDTAVPSTEGTGRHWPAGTQAAADIGARIDTSTHHEMIQTSLFLPVKPAAADL